MFCAKCGKENPSDSKFCMGCGKAISVIEPAASSSKNDAPRSGLDNKFYLSEDLIKSQLFNTIIIRNVDYYRNSFLTIATVKAKEQKLLEEVKNLPKLEQVKKIAELERESSGVLPWKALGGFSWYAGIFSWFWFAYRRMYLFAVLAFVVEFMLGIIADKLGTHFAVVLMVQIMFFGKMGNQLYYKHINKQLTDCGNEQMIPSIGGVSIPAVIVMIAFILAISALLGLTAR